MELDKIPQWLLALEPEDVTFLKNFVLKSGSLKEIARLYQVSYPTVRLRLEDRAERPENGGTLRGLYQGAGGGFPHRPGDGQTHPG